MRIVLKFFAILSLFLGIWLVLAQVDWVTHLELKKAGETIEEELGDLVWDMLRSSSDEITTDSIIQAVDSILARICEANRISTGDIKLHLLEDTQVNAVTLPDRHLVIFSGLIRECRSEDELAGVIGHELAHMELDHVMKKLISEFGLTALISLVTGGRGGEIAGEIIHVLSSSAYGRSLESDADMKAVEYLIEAEIDPAPFADFMYRIADLSDMPVELTWIASHPDPKERAEEIANKILGEEIATRPVLHTTTWQGLKQGVE